jgi:hypothetical protein
MNEKEDFSCELPMIIDRLHVLEQTLFSYRDGGKGDIMLDESFMHGLGCHLQSIGFELERINDGLYGD